MCLIALLIRNFLLIIRLGYYELFEYGLTMGGSNYETCRQRVRTSFDQISEHVSNGDGDLLQNRLNLCRAVQTELPADVATLFHSYIEFIAQYLEEFG